ncbi:phosphoribosylamine--glycine ligase [Listeria sp. PSOL-1]|uniref:phosphoribosylamine--glycine ligase n=1 Tax=Listeria sp. PSOL-1 TaxID=1844999 RepID=UPI0013D36168|nr:phosphoribosylamine--glycine ligase [Listeria sp. PSOL-1]
MNILVIGRGGREHAICKKLLESNKVAQVFCAPGSDALVKEGIICPNINEMDFEKLINFAKENRIAFVIIGPEVPLLEGMVDAFSAAGIKAFGPTKRAALIEGSKDFAKQFMQKYQIPTASSKTFTDYEHAQNYVNQVGAPIVIKADGLADGKGVVVAMTLAEATLALKEMLLENKFEKASEKVVIEEFLVGEEFSLMAFVNGKKIYPMEVAKDHKRAYDGAKGPNTGGMGAYSPVPQISEALVDEAIQNVLVKAANGLFQENRAFRGVLYAGLMATSSGVKVIEFNARFGDPETQVVLPRLTSDFAELIQALLDDEEPVVTFKETGVNLGIVLASKGYPAFYEKNHLVTGLTELSAEVTVYHAGTYLNEAGEFISNGGRVLLLTLEAKDMTDARQQLYKEMEKLDTPSFFYRIDIGGEE